MSYVVVFKTDEGRIESNRYFETDRQASTYAMRRTREGTFHDAQIIAFDVYHRDAEPTHRADSFGYVTKLPSYRATPVIPTAKRRDPDAGKPDSIVQKQELAKALKNARPAPDPFPMAAFTAMRSGKLV